MYSPLMSKQKSTVVFELTGLGYDTLMLVADIEALSRSRKHEAKDVGADRPWDGVRRLACSLACEALPF